MACHHEAWGIFSFLNMVGPTFQILNPWHQGPRGLGTSATALLRRGSQPVILRCVVLCTCLPCAPLSKKLQVEGRY